jgi:hypothetical protein
MTEQDRGPVEIQVTSEATASDAWLQVVESIKRKAELKAQREAN